MFKIVPQIPGVMRRDQSLILKFRLTPVFLSKKIKFDPKQELSIPARASNSMHKTQSFNSKIRDQLHYKL
jgi:hypothetical protein